MSEKNNALAEYMPGTEEAVDAAEASKLKAARETGIKRMESCFALQGELVGAIARKVSNKGGVRLSILPLKSSTGPSLASVYGLTDKDALRAMGRNRSDQLKTESCALVSRIGTSADFTGHSVSMNAKGDRITIQFAKVAKLEPKEAKAMSREDMLAALGITDDDVAKIALDKEMDAAEASKDAHNAVGNGEVSKVIPPA